MNLQNNVLRVAAQIHLTALPPKPQPPRADADAKAQKKQKRAWPSNKLAEFEIEFVDGFMADHALRGFTLWIREEDGQMFLTGPQRSYKDDGGKDQYYSFLVGKTRIVREQFAEWFIAEYRRATGQYDEPTETPDDAATE